MAAVTPPPCARFYNNLLCMKPLLLQALVQCKSPSIITPDLVEGAFGLIAFLDHQEMLDTFIDRTYVHWELIAGTDDVAFIINAVLGGFRELGKERLDEITRLVKNKEVDVEIQKKLLTLGRSLVKIGIRQLQSVGSSCIDVKKMAKVYQLDEPARK